MYKEKFSNKEKYKNIDKNQHIDIIIEYPKVIDEHYLRYVYIEGLTLAENLDKLSLSEDDFIYVDDVDNKYDNEALALFQARQGRVFQDSFSYHFKCVSTFHYYLYILPFCKM